MKGMRQYYISRIVLTVAFAVVFVMLGATWWMGVLVGIFGIAFFLVAPHSGRYAVHPEYGVTALRRDERIQNINNSAGRNAFVVLTLALGTVALYTQFAGVMTVGTSVFTWLLLLGAVVYFLSDFIQRKNA